MKGALSCLEDKFLDLRVAFEQYTTIGCTIKIQTRFVPIPIIHMNSAFKMFIVNYCYNYVS